MAVRKIQVAIMDDHAPVIEGYIARLRGSKNIEIAGTVSRGEMLDGLLASTRVDVLIMDVVVPVSDTNPSPFPILVVIPKILETYPGLAILVISMHNQPSLIKAVLEAGASGYILKDELYFLQDLPAIVEGIAHGGAYLSRQAYQAVFQGEADVPVLTRRQKQALSLCAAYPHASTTELAEHFQVASSTMRNLLSSAYEALKVHSRVAAVARAQQLGLISPTTPQVDLDDLRGGIREQKGGYEVDEDVLDDVEDDPDEEDDSPADEEV